jgi:hypothetical protein
MAPELWRARAHRALALAGLAIALQTTPASALRVVNYNVMFYPSVNVAGRNPHFRTVMGPLGAEIVVTQELNSTTAITQFRDNVLNVNEPGQWAAAPYTNGPDSNNGLFYKPSSVTLLGSWAWIPPDNLRQVNCYRLQPVGYPTTELRIYSLHLKAGNTSTDEQRRLTDAIGIRDSLNSVPPGTHVILTGDFNFYKSTDPAMQKFLESQADNDGRLYDPLNAVGNWQDNPAFATIFTQCPSTTAYRPSGSYSGGGVDDRFDLFLPTFNMNDGEGLDLLVSTYIPIGNDGQHMNKAVTEAPIAPQDTAYARALWWASDHLPIRVDIQLPSKASAPASLALGTVIVGGGADLSVSNPATAPADELTLSFSPPAGFTAPVSGQVAAGGSAPFTIGTAAGPAGPRAGTLNLGTDAPDQPSLAVSLSADVLDHAEPSLDSLQALLTDTIDFGQHEAGAFETRLARVHNLGFDALQARLSLSGGAITGGDGRFSIVGGFSPSLVAGTAASHTIAFDDAGATPDVDYEATLTFTSADETLPGAIARPPLEVALIARVTSGPVGVGDGARPALTRLYAPAPNPLRAASTIRFDLADAADARLEVFDLSGRKVATLASGPHEAGVYRVRWDGREGGATVGAGLYFLRLSGTGMPTRTARLAVIR